MTVSSIPISLSNGPESPRQPSITHELSDAFIRSAIAQGGCHVVTSVHTKTGRLNRHVLFVTDKETASSIASRWHAGSGDGSLVTMSWVQLPGEVGEAWRVLAAMRQRGMNDLQALLASVGSESTHTHNKKN